MSNKDEVIDRLISENSYLRNKIRNCEHMIQTSISGVSEMTFEGTISHLVSLIEKYEKERYETINEFNSIKKEVKENKPLIEKIEAFLKSKLL